MDGSAGTGALTAAFSQWMQLRLGYHAATRRALAQGKARNQPYALAIHGRAFAPTWRFLHSLGAGALILAVLLENAIEHATGLIESGVTPNRLAVLGAIALLAAYVGRTRTQRHAWVECPELRRPVNALDIKKLIAAVADVRENPAAKWKPNAVMFVSGLTGFDAEATALAASNSIQCFQRNASGDFERVSGSSAP